jgi:hypothetical protein
MKAKIIHVLCEGQTEQGFVEKYTETTAADTDNRINKEGGKR